MLRKILISAFLISISFSCSTVYAASAGLPGRIADHKAITAPANETSEPLNDEIGKADNESIDPLPFLFAIIGLLVALRGLTEIHRAESLAEERRSTLILAIGALLLLASILRTFPFA